MISQLVIDDIERLLEEGRLSQRAIGRKLGVSRTVVAAVAARRRERREAAEAPPQPPVRCPTCGNRVWTPCVYCRAMAYRKKKARDGWRRDEPSHGTS